MLRRKRNEQAPGGTHRDDSFLDAGYLGADRFYKGQTGLGVLKAVTLGAFGVWWLIDAFYYTFKAGESMRT